MACEFRIDAELGSCPQQATSGSEYCHYHKKIVAGLLEKSDEYLDDTEFDSLFGGRARNDGRRLDHYVKL